MTYRAHKIEKTLEGWVYSDTKESVTYVKGKPQRPCGHCNKPETPNEHDPCIADLPYLQNACCGHGDPSRAYVQFLNGSTIHGADAKVLQNILLELKQLKTDAYFMRQVIHEQVNVDEWKHLDLRSKMIEILYDETGKLRVS